MENLVLAEVERLVLKVLKESKGQKETRVLLVLAPVGHLVPWEARERQEQAELLAPRVMLELQVLKVFQEPEGQLAYAVKTVKWDVKVFVDHKATKANKASQATRVPLAVLESEESSGPGEPKALKVTTEVQAD